MGKSFQDQLLALGLVDKNKAKAAKKEKHQHKKKQKTVKDSRPSAAEENAELARQAEEKKKARARELNLEREEKLQKRADDARARQMIEQHRLEKDEKGIAYRFNVDGKIHRIFVAKEMADKLSTGRLGIVGLGEQQFEVVPGDVIAKIREISDRFFLFCNELSADQDVDPDDPYAAYQVPDDLMW